jgi:putative ABC transport system permease protein
MTLDESSRANRRSHIYGVIARLKNESSLQSARAEMDTIARGLERQYPRWNQDAGIQVVPLTDEVVGNIRPALLVLFGAVACVLLIAGVNVASILLARSAARQRETAIRIALGASKLELLREYLCESIAVALIAGGLGTVLASVGIDVLLELIPEEVPRQSEVAITDAVLGFVLIASMVTGVLLGLVSAFQSFHLDLQQSLKDGGRSFIGSSGKHRFRRILVVAEVGLATALLVGSALLIQSYWRIRQVDPGFRNKNVLMLDLLLPRSSYADWHEITSFYSRLLEGVASLPGVRSVAMAYDHPLETSWYNGFSIEGRTQIDIEPVGKYRPVSPGYFRTMGITLLRGRSFNGEDDPHHPGVVIVNEALAMEYFADDDPIGQWLTIDPPSAIWGDVMPKRFEVIGVVADLRFSGLEGDVEPAYYLPAAQSPLRDMSIAIRTESAPLHLVEKVRQEVWTLDPDLPVSGVTTMSAVLEAAVAQPRFNMLLLGLFGAMSLLLAAIGIYGLLSYTVSQRTNEIGIRMALGAQRVDITGLVVGHGLRLTLMGLGLGCLLALGLTWIMKSLLFGVSATDPMTFVAVAVFLAGVALLASYLPARRASRVDPLAALRME